MDYANTSRQAEARLHEDNDTSFSPPKPAPPKPAPHWAEGKYTGGRPVYLCPEMGQTCFRPGAYDAYALPSLFGAKRMPHRFQD